MSTKICPCNGLLTLEDGWCPHMSDDADKHIAWQQLNKIPDWLCKYKKVPAIPLPSASQIGAWESKFFDEEENLDVLLISVWQDGWQSAVNQGA
jgi:hypothetical protein